MLEVRIGVAGRAVELRLVELSAFAALDVDAVRDGLFGPARQGQLAMAARVEVPIAWRLAKS